jgi:hypothetical protein
MRRYIVVFIIGLVISSGLVVFAQPVALRENKNTNIEQTTFVFSQPGIIDDENYVYITFDEENSYLMEQGKPLIPSYLETYYFPFGTKINSVTVTTDDSNTQTLSKMLAPTPQMYISGERSENEYILDYGTEPYPSTWYAYRVGCGRFDNELQIIVTVEVYPFKYHPQEQIIEYVSEAEVLIDYEIATPTPTIQSSNDNYQLIVIAPSQFSSQIAPLITHKEGRGVTSKFVSLTDIYNGVYFPATGRDNPEKIKYFIKNAVENWLTGSVLLVGGSNYVPARETHVYLANDPVYGDEIFVTDLYYADIYNATGGFSCWDTNNNDIFGEYNWNGEYDEVDLYPDVYLARLPATSGSQVTTAVNKIVNYENNPAYLQDWFNTFVLVGGDTFVGDTHEVPEGEYSNEKALEIMDGFVPDKIWATNGKLGGVIPTGVANIQSAINSGAGFVDMSGHGNTNIWATHPLGDSSTWIPTPIPGGFRLTHIGNLNNGNKLPIVTVEACSTAKFNVDPNCYNWAFIHKSNGGAIGTFGATAIGYGYGGTAVIQGLIGKIGLDTYRGYRLDGATTLGEMWARSINRYIKPNMNAGDYKTVEEWTVFGEPTLTIATESQPPAKPQTPSGPASFKIRVAQTFTTSTTDPEGDQIYYMWDWGDGTTSGWIGPYNSGETASATNTWNSKGDYEIRVVARDEHGQLSPWSDPLPITASLSLSYVVKQILSTIRQQNLNMPGFSTIELLGSYTT